MKLNKIANKVAPNLDLKETVMMSQIENKELMAEIKGFYNDGDTKAVTLIGTIINACITENKPAFMLSRSLMYGLVKSDKNLPKNTELYPRDYKELLMRMIKSELFECIHPPSMKKKGMSHNIAGLYRIKNVDLRKYFKDINIQESNIIKEYYDYQNIPLIK